MGVRRIPTRECSLKNINCPFSYNVRYNKIFIKKNPYCGLLNLQDNFQSMFQLPCVSIYFQIVNMSNYRYVFRETEKRLSGQMPRGENPFLFIEFFSSLNFNAFN